MPSHDIDLIVDSEQLQVLKGVLDEFSMSAIEVGRKWRATLSGIHFNLYVPYESELGQHLQLAAERLARHAAWVGTWHVLGPAAHLATKIAALLDRPASQPGRKDRLEIVDLVAITTPDALAHVMVSSSKRGGGFVAQLTDRAFGCAMEAIPERRLSRAERDRIRSFGSKTVAAILAATGDDTAGASPPVSASLPERCLDPPQD